MKRTRKYVTFLLLAAMLLSSVSCTGGEITSDTTEDTSTPDIQTTVPEETQLTPDLPEKKFDGAEFVVLDFNEGDGVGSFHNAFEFYTETYNGEILNDAVYDRNLRIQEKYDVVISESGNREPAQTARQAVLSNDKLYSICVDRTALLASYAQQETFMPMEEVPYIDLEKPWWDQHAQDGFSIGGNLFFSTGDYVLFDKMRIYAMFVNKDMMQDFKLGDIYELVDEGKWTFEQMDTMARITADDTNGDGTVHYRDDRFGLVLGSYDCYEGFFYGMGNRISQKDEDDLPVLCLYTEKAISSMEKLTGLLNDKDVSVYGQIATEEWTLAGSPQYIFEENRALFYQEVLQVAMVLDTDIDYGIIPLPKYDENQEDYMTSSQYLLAMGIAIPKTTPDAEMTGILLEALSADSMYSTMPAFVETVLKVKKSPDERGAEMLDMLLDSINYDVGAMYDWGGYHGLISDAIPRGSSETISSAYASREPAALNALNKTVEIFTSIGKD